MRHPSEPSDTALTVSPIGLLIFRVATAWITLALIIFVLWISGGSTVGRIIAVGVLAFGVGQWFVLRYLSRQVAGSATEAQETTDDDT